MEIDKIIKNEFLKKERVVQKMIKCKGVFGKMQKKRKMLKKTGKMQELKSKIALNMKKSDKPKRK